MAAADWTGLDSLEAERLLGDLRPQAERAMHGILLLFDRELKKTLQQTPKHGRTYKVSKSGRLHVASAPGEAPAVLYGALVKSVGFTEPTWDGWTLEAEIGVNTTYARRLEFGGVDSRGVRILPRPYMEPTALRVEPMIDALLAASA